MFLKDEFAVNRLRAMRFRVSLLVAIMAVAASLVTGFGFVSVARAAETPEAIVHMTDMPSSFRNTMTLVHAPAPEKWSNGQQHYANEKIMRGLTLIFFALTGTSLLAIWRRRIRDVVLPVGNRHAD